MCTRRNSPQSGWSRYNEQRIAIFLILGNGNFFCGASLELGISAVAAVVLRLVESVRAQSNCGFTGTVGSVAALSTGGDFGAQTMVLVSMVLSLIGGALILLTAQKTEF